MKNCRALLGHQAIFSGVMVPSILWVTFCSWSLSVVAKPQVSWIQEQWTCEATEPTEQLSMDLRLWYPEGEVVVLNWLVKDCDEKSCTEIRADNAKFVPVTEHSSGQAETKNLLVKNWPHLKVGVSFLGEFADAYEGRLTLIEVEAAKYPIWFVAKFHESADQLSSIELACSR